VNAEPWYALSYFQVRQARESVGLTQEDIAGKMKTKKSTISLIENHSQDVRVSMLMHYTEALGKKLNLSIQ